MLKARAGAPSATGIAISRTIPDDPAMSNRTSTIQNGPGALTVSSRSDAIRVTRSSMARTLEMRCSFGRLAWAIPRPGLFSVRLVLHAGKSCYFPRRAVRRSLGLAGGSSFCAWASLAMYRARPIAHRRIVRSNHSAFDVTIVEHSIFLKISKRPTSDNITPELVQNVKAAIKNE